MDGMTESSVNEQREKDLRRTWRGWRDYLLFQVVDLRFSHGLLAIGAIETVLAPVFGLKLAAFRAATCFAGYALTFASASSGNQAQRFVDLYEIEVARAMELSKKKTTASTPVEMAPLNKFPI
jgi:hypothetical protein